MVQGNRDDFETARATVGCGYHKRSGMVLDVVTVDTESGIGNQIAPVRARTRSMTAILTLRQQPQRSPPARITSSPLSIT